MIFAIWQKLASLVTGIWVWGAQEVRITSDISANSITNRLSDLYIMQLPFYAMNLGLRHGTVRYPLVSKIAHDPV